MSRVEGEMKVENPFQGEKERGLTGELCEFDRDTSNRGAGKGIHIIEGDKTVKVTRYTDVNERISTSFFEGFVHGFFEIGISKRNDRQDKMSTGLPLGQT